MNMSLIEVAELVAVVTMHPAVAVDVAFAVFVTVRIAEPVPPPTVRFPDNTVELADAFLIVSPLRSWNEEAPKTPTTVEEACDMKPPVSVERLVTPSVVENAPDVPLNAPFMVSAPAAVVVAFPPTHKGPPMVADWVVEAFTNVLTPVADSVPSV